MKKILSVFIFATLLYSCEEDKSSNAEIIDLSIIEASNSELIFDGVYIEPDDQRLYIFLNNDLSNINFPISFTADFKLSSGAKTASIVGNEISFSNSDEVKLIEVQAEDGTKKEWYIQLVHKQMQNAGFENWFDNKGMNGKLYTEIGESDIASIWSTANLGTSMYSVYCTQPLLIETNTLAEIVTGETPVVPITAGTLFIGTFDLGKAMSNPTDPKQATSFGVPFIYRPTAMKFNFKYQAGEQYIQAIPKNPESILEGFTVNEIEGQDKCSIYAILEIRNNDQVTEIARAEMESGTTVDVMEETILTFNYTSTESPTHISIVFTSSIEGDLWKGAIGSKLVIDDLELIYE